MEQAVYRDPSGAAGELSLVDELGKVPTTAERVPAEDQLSTFLAWLADHCPAFARELARRFLRGDEEGLRALERAERLDARVQIRLPSIGKGLLWADVSLDGSDRELQLLIEVKLTSDFHRYELEGGAVLSQPDAYLHAWRLCDENGEARVRRVGTLTLAGKAPSGGDPWRAADCSWGEIADLIWELLARGEFSPEIEEIATELGRHIRERVLPPEVPAGFLEWGSRLTRGVCEGLAGYVTEPKVSGTFSANEKFHYAGGYLELTAPDGKREKLWFVVAPAGGDYNVPGAPASLQITSYNEDPLSARTAERLRAVGFDELKDKNGYRLLRVALPVTDIAPLSSDLDAQIEVAADWALELLDHAGLATRDAGG